MFQAVSRLNSVSATASPYPNRSAKFLNKSFFSYYLASPVIFRRGPSTVSSPMDLKKNRWLLPKPDLLLKAVIADWPKNSEHWTFGSKRVLSTLQQCKWTEECPYVIWPRAFSNISEQMFYRNSLSSYLWVVGYQNLNISNNGWDSRC